MSYERELEAALEAAESAGGVVLELYESFEVIHDAPADISTEADHRSQELILGFLHRTFPKDSLCAEETSAALEQTARDEHRLWIVDPIDGTRGFARKNGEFSIMIGFVERGQIAVGVVLEPVKNRCTYATRGGGCHRHDGTAHAVACCVSSVDALTASTFVQSHSRNPAPPTAPVEAIRPARVVETYSAGIKLALVARGEADIYANTYDAFHDWDICAGHILVEEAGGKVSGLAGEELHYGLPGNWQRHGLLATNGKLHSAALKALSH